MRGCAIGGLLWLAGWLAFTGALMAADLGASAMRRFGPGLLGGAAAAGLVAAFLSR